MPNRASTLLLALTLAGCDLGRESTLEPKLPSTEPITSSEHEPSDVEREAELAAGEADSTNPLAANDIPMFDESILADRYHSDVESRLHLANPESFEKRRASDAEWDFYDEDPPASSALSFSTSSLFGRTAPRAGVTLERDPAKKTYKVNGGEFFLPAPGVGVSYEKDAETGETKTFLNLKRNF